MRVGSMARSPLVVPPGTAPSTSRPHGCRALRASAAHRGRLRPSWVEERNVAAIARQGQLAGQQLRRGDDLAVGDPPTDGAHLSRGRRSPPRSGRARGGGGWSPRTATIGVPARYDQRSSPVRLRQRVDDGTRSAPRAGPRCPRGGRRLVEDGRCEASPSTFPAAPRRAARHGTSAPGWVRPGRRGPRGRRCPRRARRPRRRCRCRPSDSGPPGHPDS